jgi:hypothetical protein
MDGFDYIPLFFDRINRIYWIFYSLFLDETKNILMILLSCLIYQKYTRIHSNCKIYD